MMPKNEQTPINNPAFGGAKKSKKKLWIILGSVLAVVLLAGGVAAVLIYKNIQNKPENILKQSIYNELFKVEGPERAKGEVKLKFYQPEVELKDLSLGFDIVSSGGNTQLDLEFEVSIFKLNTSIFVEPKTGNFYVKIADLDSLLGSGLAEEFRVPLETRAQIERLGDRWIEVTPEDIKDLAGSDVSSGDYSKCTEAVESLMGNKVFQEDFKAAYSKNEFVVIEESSIEIVDGQELLKTKLGLDEILAEEFGNNLKNSSEQFFSELAGACYLGSFEDEINDDSVDGSIPDFQDTELTVWMDRSAKKIRKVSFTSDVYEFKEKVYTLSLDMSASPYTQNLEVPSNTVGIGEVLELLGLKVQRELRTQFN